MKKINLHWLKLTITVLNLLFVSNIFASESVIPVTTNQISDKLNKGRETIYNGNRYVWDGGKIYKIGKNGQRSLMRGIEQKIIERVNPLAILDADNIESTCNGNSRSVSSKISIIIEYFLGSDHSVLVKSLWIPSKRKKRLDLEKFGKNCIQNLKNIFIEKGVHDDQFRIPERLLVKETDELIDSLLVEVIRVD